jgi:hypothetical protein
MSSRILLLASLLTGACADLERGPAAPSPDAAADGAGDGGTASFAPAHAVLTGLCAHCHAAGQAAGNTTLLLVGDASDDLATARRFVDLDHPTASRLLVKAAGQGHGGGTVLRADSPEYAALLAWIQSGAGP